MALPLWESVCVRRGFAPPIFGTWTIFLPPKIWPCLPFYSDLVGSYFEATHFQRVDDFFPPPKKLTKSIISFRSCWVPFWTSSCAPLLFLTLSAPLGSCLTQVPLTHGNFTLSVWTPSITEMQSCRKARNWLVPANHTPQRDKLLACSTLTHWGRDKMDAISQMTFTNAFFWMKMFEFRLKFHWSLFLRAQLAIFQHWFR